MEVIFHYVFKSVGLKLEDATAVVGRGFCKLSEAMHGEAFLCKRPLGTHHKDLLGKCFFKGKQYNFFFPIKRQAENRERYPSLRKKKKKKKR